MTIIDNKYKFGQDVWHNSLNGKPLHGYVHEISRSKLFNAPIYLVYKDKNLPEVLNKLCFIIREDQLFLTKEEAENADKA